MENYLLLFVNALAHAGVFTKDEAKKLCDELYNSTLPSDFEGSWRQVEKIFEKLELSKKVVTK